MKESIKIASALVGVLVGAGYASGQEIALFFVNFGMWGILGSVLGAVLFAFLGMSLANIGSRVKAVSHKQVITAICGKYLGQFIDWSITFFMFAITVVMIAGGAALLQQQYALDTSVGGLLVTAAIIAVVCLDIQRVIMLIGIVTPFLILIALYLSGYAFFSRELSFDELGLIAQEQPKGATHWLIAALLFVSYNFIAGVPMLAIMGGNATGERSATWGGILGGATLGILMAIMSLGMLSRLDITAGLSMPMLGLADKVSPFIGLALSLVILGMVLNTGVAMLFSFIARFQVAGTRHFRYSTIIIGLIAYAASSIGFTALVGKVYPVFGYIGFFLIMAVIVAWLRIKVFKKAIVCKHAIKTN
ncbi:hypothetical protein VQ643_03285 [Pseudomonas sp. F1_0610]|uniref:YkvI family membrane protein n=1 Tax=Pseudomonas sp. F1_0610 TaxID=3114284 RepID=UPI0039C40275